jgi:hypothetical protein
MWHEDEEEDIGSYCYWMTLRKREDTWNWKKNTRLHSVENSLWKSLWTCHKRLQNEQVWRWNRQSVPKRWDIKFRRRGITQKKAYNIQNMAEVWNQEWTPYKHLRRANVVKKNYFPPTWHSTFCSWMNVVQ